MTPESPASGLIVVGHVNPDTDSIASAIGYAWTLSRLGQPATPARAGALNPQTSWLLDQLDVDPPMLLADASPQFRTVARWVDTLAPDLPLRDAWHVADGGRSVVPVVAEDNSPVGLVTGASVFAFLSRRVSAPGWERMTVAELLAAPCREAADTGVPKFEAGTRIRDALPRILREERDDFWVVDDDGRYLGVVHKPDALAPPRLRLVLVDHNEPGQSVGSLEEAELVEVLDHHRLGNPPTALPIAFRVDPVGSTSTLVFERIADAGLLPPPEVAALLLGGLLADTLRLTSPTTTDRDRAAAPRLAEWAFNAGPLEGWTLEKFGMELLKSGAGLGSRSPDEIATGDYKRYEAEGKTFGMAQAEVTDFAELEARVPELQAALERMRESRGLDFAVLMVTDIVRGSSRILLASPPPELDALPYPRLPNGLLKAKGVVSRKKQLLPAILGLLQA